MIEVLSFPGFLVTYALLQAVVLLLLIRFLDLYQREPMWVIALMALWGATGAAMLSLAGNEALDARLPADIGLVFGAAITAPIVEELAKGAALVAVFFVSLSVARRWGIFPFEGVTDGIVYGAAIGLGFSFTEDIVYLLNFSALEGVQVGLEVYLERVDFLGLGMLQHSIYTGLFGAGLGLATWSRRWGPRIGFPALGLALGMLAHAAHNGLVQLLLVRRYGFDTMVAILSNRPVAINPAEFEAAVDGALSVQRSVGVGFAVVFLLLLVVWVRHQRQVIAFELAEEVEAGRVSAAEADLTPAYWTRLRREARLARAGRLDEVRALRRLHHALVDLAFTKWRVRSLEGDPALVDAARARVPPLPATAVAGPPGAG